MGISESHMYYEEEEKEEKEEEKDELQVQQFQLYEDDSPKIVNFMGGDSYILSPFDTLYYISASSIFGEPSYYIKGSKDHTILDNKDNSYSLDWEDNEKIGTRTTSEIFEKAVDDALQYNFKDVLDLAVTLRTTYNMRLNPSIILVRAAIHNKRELYNKNNPNIFREVGKKIIGRPDDMTNQLNYYLHLFDSKKGLPSCLKRLWAEVLKGLSKYHIHKYQNTAKLIDLTRISHANSENLNELMRTGTVTIGETEKTWEILKSYGENWAKILTTIKVPHMALLRNIRGIALDKSVDIHMLIKATEQLESGVEYGKQFPFRYYTASKSIDKEYMVDMSFKIIQNSLNRCLEIAMKNFPKLEGKSVSLCDNSGSAHKAYTSRYGSVTVSSIGNLSGVMTAMNSTEGEVVVFGDKMERIKINHNISVLKNLKIVEEHTNNIGQATENGIWLFFEEAIRNRLWYDNIFVYSDMQAGNGELYGIEGNPVKYRIGSKYIDILKLIKSYRSKVNPKMNFFSVQIAGYANNITPNLLYRGALLSGWTGSEVVYAKALIEKWNEIDLR